MPLCPKVILRRCMFRHLDSNFSQTKEAVEMVHLQHPFVYDQLALCALAMEGALKYLKLHMLSDGAITRDKIHLFHPCAERIHNRRF